VYLAWFDDHPRKELRFKIAEAIFAYEDRFGERPNVVLVNEDVEGVRVVSRPYVRKDNFWVGIEGLVASS